MSVFLIPIWLIFFPLILTLGNPIQGRIDSGLDPNRILWWRTKWCPLPLELSQINAESSGVTVTLRWSPSTDIPSGIIELEFPRSFYVPGGNPTITSPISNILSGYDYTTVFSALLDNPASGIYGPIKVRTRYSSRGQIIDSNDNFTLLSIAPKEKLQDSTLLVSLENNPRVGEHTKVLKVSFTLLQNIYKYDVISLGLDSHWTLSDTFECHSYSDATTLRYFNGTDSSDLSKIACSTEMQNDKKILQIYGLGNDIDISNEAARNVQLRLSYVSVPKARYDSYDWNLKISKFGTRWVYQLGSYTAGPSVETGVITSGTWRPTYNYIDKSAITAGISLFIDIQIPILNTIPAGGSIQITVSDKLNPDLYYGNISNGCWVSSPRIKGMICKANAVSNTLNISGFTENIQPRTIIISTVVLFTGTTFGIKSVNTYYGEFKYLIDSGSNLDIYTLASSSNFQSISLQLYIRSSYYGNEFTNFEAGRTLSSEYLSFSYLLPYELTNTSNFKYKLFFPFTQVNTEDRLNKFYISSKQTKTYSITCNYYSNYNSYYTETAIDSSSITLQVESDRTYLYYDLSFLSSQSPVGGSYVLKMQITDNNDNISFPLVASNASSRYLIVLEVKNPSNPTLSYYGIFFMNIIPKYIDGVSYVNNISRNILGRLSYISFNISQNYPLYTADTKTYYLEVAFLQTYVSGYSNEYLNSGMKDGDTYPVACENLGKDCQATIWYDGLYTYLRYKNISVTASSTAIINFTYGDFLYDYNSYVYLRLYYTQLNDPTGLKHISYEKSYIYYTNTYYNYNMNYDYIQDITVDSDSITLPGFNSYYNSFILTVYGNFAFTESTKLVTKSSNTEVGINKKIFNIPGKWSTLTFDRTVSVYEEIVIKGITLPGYSDNRGVMLYLHYIEQNYYFSVYTYRLFLKPGNLSKVKIMPNNIKGRGPSSAFTDMTVYFTTNKSVPLGGGIEVQINNRWEVVSGNNDFKTTGLNPAPGKSITYSMSNNLFKVSNFNTIPSNTSITLVIRRLIPPIYIDDNPISFLSNNITTYADSSNLYTLEYFDTTKTTDDDILITSNSDVVGSAVINYLFNLPSNLNTDSNSIYMTVAVLNTIPAGAVFQVIFNNLDWLYPNGDIKNLCWIRGFKYRSCDKTSNGISIVLNEDFYPTSNIDIYLESCIKTPLYSSKIENAIQFNAIYNSYTIIQEVQGHSYIPSIFARTLTAVVSISLKTYGELATYSFSITSSILITSTDEVWILFPAEFDFFIGEVELQSDLVYTIECEGVTGIVCTVDHRVVIIRGLVTTKTNETVSLKVLNVYNPNVMITGNIVLAHYDTRSRVFKGVGMISGEVINQVSPNSLVIYKVEASERQINKTADYEFCFEFKGSLDENTVVNVKFPQEFRIDNGTSYACAMMVKSALPWASLTCEYKGNILVAALTKGQSRKFDSTTLICLKVSNVANILDPLPRLQPESDWERDLTDSTTFKLYESYSSRFSIFILSKSSNIILYKSYSEMNPSYLGYSSASAKSIITAKSSGSICEDFIAEGSSSLGKSLTYSWSIQTDTPNSKIEQFNLSLKSEVSSSTLLIPSSILQPSVLTISLTVSNSYFSDTSSITVSIRELPIPELLFTSGSYVTIPYSVPYTIYLKVTIPNCTAISSEFSYKWSISKYSVESTNKPYLTIAKSSLLPGIYIITATVSISSISTNSFSNTMKLTVQASDLKAIIIGGNRKHDVGKELKLDGRTSYDPDGIASSLSYKWNCDYSDSPCEFLSNIKFDQDMLTIPGNTLESDINYVFNLTVSHDSRHSDTSTTITTIQEDLPDVYIIPPKYTFLPSGRNSLTAYVSSDIILTSMHWSCNINSVVYYTPTDQLTIVIQEFSLSGGRTYTFTFTAEYNSIDIYSSISVYVDSPPKPGLFSISPTSGIALKTEFNFEVSEWSDLEDNLPLSYELYEVRNEITWKIGRIQGESGYKTVLGVGDANNSYRSNFMIRVYDIIGAYTEKFFSVDVNPAEDVYKDAASFIEKMQSDVRSNNDIDYIPSNVIAIMSSLEILSSLDIGNTQVILKDCIELVSQYWQLYKLPTEVQRVYSAVHSMTALDPYATSVILSDVVSLVSSLVSQDVEYDSNTLIDAINTMSNLQQSVITSLSDPDSNSTSYRIHNLIQDIGLNSLKSLSENTSPYETLTNDLYTQFGRISSDRVSSNFSIYSDTGSFSLPSLYSKISDASSNPANAIIDYILTQTHSKMFTDSNTSTVGSTSLDLYITATKNSYGEIIEQPRRKISVKNLSQGIRIELPFNFENLDSDFMCVYLNENILDWDATGCEFIENINNRTLVCECNHLSIFSAFGMTENVSFEEDNEGNSEEILEILEDEDDDSSYGIMILIVILGGLQILISGYTIQKDLKQKDKNFKLVDLGKSISPDLVKVSSNSQPVSNRDGEDVLNKYSDNLPVIDCEVLPVDPQDVMINIVIERVKEEHEQRVDEPQPHQYILNQSLNQNINFTNSANNSQDNSIIVQNLKDEDKTLFQCCVLEHEFLGFFLRKDTNYSRFLRVLVFFTGNYLGIFILGLLYNYSLDAEEAQESKSAFEIFKEYNYLDVIYNIIANAVVFLCFVLRLLLREYGNTAKLIGGIICCIISLGSIAGSVLFGLEYHVIYIQSNVTIMWSYNSAILILVRTLVIDFIVYPFKLIYDRLKKHRLKTKETAVESRC